MQSVADVRNALDEQNYARGFPSATPAASGGWTGDVVTAVAPAVRRGEKGRDLGALEGHFL